MKKFNIFIISLLLAISINISFASFCKAEILSGNVNKEELLDKSHIVIDGATGNPVSGAEVSIPNESFFTKTNNLGQFKLDTNFKGPAVLSVQADGYKPFSITLGENKINNPLTIVVTKLFGNEIIIDNELHHLGDDNYSKSSANAEDFKLKAEGAAFSKEFFVNKIDVNANPVLRIGTIIGLDTKIAHKLEGKKMKAYSSPMQVYLNSKKIAEIKINGDNQEIPLPKSLLNSNDYNTIRIETGINQMATSYIDYDDMEFMNLLFVLK